MTQKDKSGDQIHIEQLEVFAHIGVPDKERASAQRLTLNMTLWPAGDLRNLDDQIARAVDYSAVCEETKNFVQHRSDRLIETLANALANYLLENFQLERITVELRKYILPDAQYVSVTVTRERSSK